jgi:hypothetical protein
MAVDLPLDFTVKPSGDSFSSIKQLPRRGGMRGDFFFFKKEKKLQETNIHCPIFCDVLALSKIPPFFLRIQLLGS